VTHPLFGRHEREFRKAVRDRAWERSAEGIVFPRQHALLHGHVKVETEGGVVRCRNRLMSYVVSNLLFTGLLSPGGTSAAFNDMSIAPWSSAIDTTLAWENAFYTASLAPDGIPGDVALLRQLGELGDAPEGYDEATRQAWTWASAGGGLLDNSASPAAFTMRSATTITVNGFALCTGAGPPASTVKHRGEPYFSVLNPGGGYTNYAGVDVTNCIYPDFVTNSGGYVPVGAVVTGSGAGQEDAYISGRAINIDPSHFADPNGGAIDLGSLGVTQSWYDPSGDDYYDSGLGHWVDPSGDSINSAQTGDLLFAVVRLPAPLSFADMAPMNITWGLQLS
jgi:hypothetical protein